MIRRSTWGGIGEVIISPDSTEYELLEPSTYLIVVKVVFEW